MGHLSALVLGGAATLADDERAARDLFIPDLILATNHTGRDRPGFFDHWISFHIEHFERWLGERREAGRPDPGMLWTAAHRRGMRPGNLAPARIDYATSWGGSSGLLAVTVALHHLGCDRIVLAGVPLDKRSAHYDDPAPWLEACKYRNAWIQHRGEMRDTVRSMSGWTRELLGAPTEKWIDADR